MTFYIIIIIIIIARLKRHEAMKQQTTSAVVYKNKNVLFTIVSNEHIETERISTAVKLGEIIKRKRQEEHVRMKADKKAKRDAFYANLHAQIAIPTREIHARNASLQLLLPPIRKK